MSKQKKKRRSSPSDGEPLSFSLSTEELRPSKFKEFLDKARLELDSLDSDKELQKEIDETLAMLDLNIPTWIFNLIAESRKLIRLSFMLLTKPVSSIFSLILLAIRVSYGKRRTLTPAANIKIAPSQDQESINLNSETK